jgi:AraC-like DNA-binding protein
MRSDAIAIQEIRLLVAAAGRAGLDRRTLLDAAGVPPDRYADPDARVSDSTLERLVEAAVRLTGDTSFGIHAGELSGTQIRLPDPLHYALDSCATVGDQYRMIAKYARLVHGNVELTLTIDGRTARLTHRLRGGRALSRRHLSERALTGLALMLRRQTTTALREVWFAHPRPEDVSEHERVFGAPLRFEQPVDALVLDAAGLAAPVPGADPALGRVLADHLDHLLPPGPAPDALEDVRERIRTEMRGKPPSIEAVASGLAMSCRTLQRRLSARGTTFQLLVREVREDVARHQLADSELSIGEIAFVLGFSDVSAFHRAFKRWTRRTPSAFRRAAVAPGQRVGVQGNFPR